MNRRVLIVDDVPEVLDAIEEILSDSFEIHRAESGKEALDVSQRCGPFALVLTDNDMPGMSGIEFLLVMQRRWPDTTRIMLTGRADYAAAIQALHEGAVFRFLTKPAEAKAVVEAIQDGVTRYEKIAAERLLTEQLQFSRESLLDMNSTLERRLDDQLARIRRIHEFSFELKNAHTLDAVAKTTAETCAGLFPGRGLTISFEDEMFRRTVEENHGEISDHVVDLALSGLEGTIGCLKVDTFDNRGTVLSEGDREILNALASLAGVAANSQVLRRERERAQHATIYALARLAEERDDETARHLERVSDYCRLIAIGMRENGHEVETITDAWIEDIALAAPLHDIGKVGIPDAILLKPAKLTEVEWGTMKTHTTIGAETLRNVLESAGELGFLRMAYEISWCHHERWDGAGYPRGIQGEEIPLAARIVALADVYDALTTRRPYKEPWTHEDSVAYIREQRGAQFDSRVVDAFLQNERRADEIRALKADMPEDFRATSERSA